MVMFASERLYNFAKVVEHEDNKVFQTNDKTVIYEHLKKMIYSLMW